jgi:hypothetical protein
LSVDIKEILKLPQSYPTIGAKKSADYCTLPGKIVLNPSSHKITGLKIGMREKLGPPLIKTFEATSIASGEILSGMLTELAALRAPCVDEALTAYRKEAMRLLYGLWFSVEDKTEENSKYILAEGDIDADKQFDKVDSVFFRLLDDDGLDSKAKKEWDEATQNIRIAKISPEAVIVNRREMADAAEKERSGSAPIDEGAQDIISKFFKNFYGFVKYVAESKDISKLEIKKITHATSELFARRFGLGEGADFSNLTKIYQTVEKWVTDALKILQTPSSSENRVAKVDSQDLSFDTLFTELGDLTSTTKKSKPDDSKLDLLIKHLSHKGHKSGVLNILERLRKNGLESSSPVSVNTLEEFKTAAKTAALNCSLKCGDKAPKEYLTRLMAKASEKCGIPFIPSGDTKNFFLNAMNQAFGRLFANLALRGNQESQREVNYGTGIDKLKNVDDNIILFLDKYCEEQKIATACKDDYLLERREMEGYKELYKLWEKNNDLTGDEKLRTCLSFYSDELEGKRGSSLFLIYMCDGSNVFGLTQSKNGHDPAVSVNDLPGLETPASKVASIDVPPEKLFDYTDGKKYLYKAKNYKRPMLKHIHSYLSPVPMCFGSGGMRVEHDAKIHHDEKTLRYFHICLWDGERFKLFLAKWQSERIYTALGLKFGVSGPEVPLNTTAGRIAAGVDTDPASPCQVKGLYFSKENWPINITSDKDYWMKIYTTLQNSKCLSEDDKLCKLEEMKKNLNWNIFFNISLEPVAPFQIPAAKNNIMLDLDGMPAQPAKIPSGGTEVRKSQFSRVPDGIRMLGADLGIYSALS